MSACLLSPLSGSPLPLPAHLPAWSQICLPLLFVCAVLCVSQEVIFKVDYKVDAIQREFGTVFLGDLNVALAVVSDGWAKVKCSAVQCSAAGIAHGRLQMN